jgi:outer membrane receptor protein involved in Fe transport
MNNSGTISSLSKSLFAFLLGSSALTPAIAADTAANMGAPEEIVVTATKRGADTVMKTPLSVQAIGGAALEQRGALEFDDFSKLVSGLSVFDQGPGNKRYILRGINSGGAGTVGVYLDEIVLTGENSQGTGGLQADPKLFDIERIEVLKGPQGTTFGSSSLSGVIRYLVNKPDATKYSVDVRAQVTGQHYAGTGSNYDLTVNVPIVADVLAVRASGFYQKRPGYISNRYEKNYNDDETWAGRVQVRLNVGNGKLDLFYQEQDVDAGLNYFNLKDYFGAAVPKYYQAGPERLSSTDKMRLLNATFTYDTDFGTFTATASNTRRKMYLARPASQVIASAVGNANAEDPSVRSVIEQPRLSKVEAYEGRFASNWGGPVQALVGLYYQKDKRDFSSLVRTVDSLGYVGGGGVYGPVLQNRSLYTEISEKAVFGELTWNVTDQFKLTGGVRAFEFDNKSQPTVLIRPPGRPGTGVGAVTTSGEKSAIGRVIASYNFTDDLMVYAQWAQGYRPGGTNDPAAAALGGVTIPNGYTSDSITNYELGVKYASPDRRFTSAVAAYYIDWKDLQTSLFTPTAPGGSTRYTYTGNAGTARVYGLEWEATVRPTAGLSISSAMTFTDAKIEQTLEGSGVAGDRIPYTPKFAANLAVDYQFPIKDEITGFVGADESYVGDRATSFPRITTMYTKLDDYFVTNLRAGVEFSNYKITAAVRNVLDDDAVVDVVYIQPPLTVDGYLRNPPRTFSLEFSAKF